MHQYFVLLPLQCRAYHNYLENSSINIFKHKCNVVWFYFALSAKRNKMDEENLCRFMNKHVLKPYFLRGQKQASQRNLLNLLNLLKPFKPFFRTKAIFSFFFIRKKNILMCYKNDCSKILLAPSALANHQHS